MRLQSIRRFASVGAAVFVMTGGLLAPAVGAPAAPRVTSSPQDILLTSGTLAVTSSTNQKLDLSISADDFDPAGCTTDSFGDDLDVSVSTPTGRETHAWDFEIACSDFTESDGNATLTVPATELGSFGSFDLTFTEASNKSVACGKATPSTVYTGSLSGTFQFRTTSAWGVLGDGTTATSFPEPDTLTETANGCNTDDDTSPVTDPLLTNGNPPCGSVDAYALVKGNQELDLATGGKLAGKNLGLFAIRSVMLKSPKYAVRTDEIQTRVPAPKFSPADKGKEAVVSITTSGDQDSGSATITTTGKAKTQTEKCAAGKSTKKEKVTGWAKGKLKNAKKALKIGADVFGDFTFDSSYQADVVESKGP